MSDIAAKHNGIQMDDASTGVNSNDLGLLFLRLALGVVFTAHGWMMVSSFHQTMAGMTHGGIPAPLVLLTMFTELGGGLAVLFGLLARLASLGITVVMLVAIFKVHLHNGFFMNWYGNLKGEGYEYHILVIAMCLMIALAGPGRIALADFEGRILRGQRN